MLQRDEIPSLAFCEPLTEDVEIPVLPLAVAMTTSELSACHSTPTEQQGKERRQKREDLPSLAVVACPSYS